jgi:hypothetical protein
MNDAVERIREALSGRCDCCPVQLDCGPPCPTAADLAALDSPLPDLELAQAVRACEAEGLGCGLSDQREPESERWAVWQPTDGGSLIVARAPTLPEALAAYRKGAGE